MLKRILAILGFTAAAIFVVGGTFVLVSIGRGYSYDFKSNRFIVNGLVVFDSEPNGASIFVNNKQVRRKTPYRTTLEAGVYGFEVTREGYQTWRKDLEIAPSSVTWAQYIVLFPQNIKSSRLYGTSDVRLLAASPDRKQYAYVAGSSVWHFKLGAKAPTKVYTAAAATPEQPAETIAGLTWSDDGERMLVTTRRGTASGHRVMTTASSQVLNLNEVFGFSFGDLRFDPTASNQMYWNSPEGLRRLSLGDRTVSAVLAPAVKGFGFGGGDVFYIRTTELGHSLWSLDQQGKTRQLVESLAASDSYQIAYSTYQRQPRLAVIPASTSTLTLYTGLGQHLDTRVLSKQAQAMAFNGDGRFLAYWTVEGLGTYDSEKQRRTTFRRDYGPVAGVSWYDNYHLLVSHGSQVSSVEFDGHNLTPLAKLLPGQVAWGSAGEASLVFINAKSPSEPGRLYRADLH